MAIQNSSDAVKWLGIEKMAKQFEALPDRLQRLVLRQAVAAGGTALTSSIRKVTPQSSKTGSGKHWSQKTARQRMGKPKNPLRRALKKKPSSKWRSSKAQAALGIVATAIGHEWKIAPHAHIVNYGHKAHYWSKTASGETVKGTNYFQKGIMSAKSTVRSKITSSAKRNLAKAITKSLAWTPRN